MYERRNLPRLKIKFEQLRHLGGTDILIRIADRFGICDLYVDIESAAQNQLKRRFMQWPDQQERHQIDNFSRQYNFPSIVGAHDGAHIKIRAPKHRP